MPGRPRAVLLSLAVRPAGRACACKHDSRHSIARGEPRLIVKNPGPASGESGYCITCAQHMLSLARAELDRHSRSLARTAEELHGRPGPEMGGPGHKAGTGRIRGDPCRRPTPASLGRDL
jgi:hypothetical protein